VAHPLRRLDPVAEVRLQVDLPVAGPAANHISTVRVSLGFGT
jgi:hypothetical protein